MKYMSLFLYVHQKRDAFSLSLYIGSNKGIKYPSLLNIVTYPLCLQTEFEMTSNPIVSALASDSKTQIYTTLASPIALLLYKKY